MTLQNDHDHHSDYGPAQLALFGVAAFVLLVFCVDHPRRSDVLRWPDDARKGQMEIEIAFLALAFFAAFMAARSLTAYFKKSNSAANAARSCHVTVRF